MRAASLSIRTTIHLIRHADAVPALDDALDARTDYDALGLTATGRAQAAALAARLAAVRTPPVAVYSSDVRRARETASAVATALGVSLTVDARLRETGLGRLDAGTVEAARRPHAMRARLTELAAIAVRDGSWDAVPDAEPAASVRARMTAAVTAIAARHPGAHVAVVSHAGAINAYLAPVVGTARDFFFPAGNTSLSSVRISAGGASLLRLNDTAHLEPLAATTS